MDRIRLAFKSESLERLERLRPMADSLSTTGGDLACLIEMIRSEIHMMKGAAGMLELPAIRDKVSALEEWVEKLPRSGPLPGLTSAQLKAEFEMLRGQLGRIQPD